MKEFVTIWFEESQQWMLLFSDGTLLKNFPAEGYARNKAFEILGQDGPTMEVTEDTGNFYRYEPGETGVA